MTYKFTEETRWFSQVAKQYFEEYLLPRADEINTVIEIGAWEGESAVWMIENLKPEFLIVVDPFTGADDHQNNRYGHLIEGLKERYEHNISEVCKNNTWTVVATCVEPSERAWKYMSYDNISRGREVDLVYIDGSHKSKDVMIDLIGAWLTVRKGGYIVCDDYNWGVGDSYYQKLPKYAIDTFKTMFKNDIEILLLANTVIMRKK